MVEHVQSRGIEIDAVLDIADEGVVGPAVPQAGDDIEEFAGPPVAVAMLHVLGEPEIQRCVGVGGGNQVPAGTAAADVVERREAPGDQVGRLESRRGGRDQPEIFSHHRERRQQGQWIERGDGRAVLQRGHRHVEHGQMVGHEKGVEPAALEGLRKADQMPEIEIGIGVSAGITPPGGMNTDRAHERPKMQVAWCHHRCRCSPFRSIEAKL